MRHVLHQPPFAPNNFAPGTFFTKHLLHQTTFTPLLHQTPSSQQNVYTTRLLGHTHPHTIYMRHLLHQAPFAPHTFYSKHHANTGATQTPGSLRGVLATQAKAPEHSTGTPREHPGHTHTHTHTRPGQSRCCACHAKSSPNTQRFWHLQEYVHYPRILFCATVE